MARWLLSQLAMKKLPKAKLTLGKETLRPLVEKHLARVVGGAYHSEDCSGSCSCDATMFCTATQQWCTTSGAKCIGSVNVCDVG